MRRGNSSRRQAGQDHLKIRPARIADLPGLAALYEQLHLEGYGSFSVGPVRMRRQFMRLSADRNHRILVAELDGRPVGTAHLIIVEHLGHGLKPFGIVENVVVDSAIRSAGIGARLMEEVDRIARRRGCYKLALTSNLSRRRSHGFYARLGWRRTHLGFSLGLE